MTRRSFNVSGTANRDGRFLGLPCNVTIEIHVNLLRSYAISSAGKADAGRKTDKAWGHGQRDGLPQQCAAEQCGSDGAE